MSEQRFFHARVRVAVVPGAGFGSLLIHGEGESLTMTGTAVRIRKE